MNDDNRSAYVGILEATEKRLVRENKKLLAVIDSFLHFADDYIEQALPYKEASERLGKLSYEAEEIINQRSD